MKRIFVVMAIIIWIAPCTAQWKSAGLRPDPIGALGVSDSNLFLAVNGYHIFRWAPWLPPYHVIYSDTGIYYNQIGNITSFATIGSNLFCSATNGPVYRTTNNGKMWFKTPGTGYGDVIALCATDTVLYMVADLVYQSTDLGDSWNRMVPGSYTSIAASGDIVLAGLKTGVYVSSDAGQHWTPDPINQVVNAVAIKGTTLFAGLDYSNNAILRSTNMGATWDASLVAQLKVTAFALHGNAIFAGTNGGGVYLSTDTGRNWTAINTGLGNLNVTCLAVQDTLLWAGTTNDLFYRPLRELLPKSDVVEQVPPLGDTLAIYPNPLTNVTTISYSLRQDARVSIVMFDALGRSVATPAFDIEASAGEHQITFDASQLPSGVYWCHLSAGSVERSAKIVIER